MAKKVIKEVKVIKEFQPHKVNYSKEKSVSFSQFNAFHDCNLRWSLAWIEKLQVYQPSIHTVFGTAMHETIQEWLEVLYEKTVKDAMEMDLNSLLLEKMKSIYRKDVGTNSTGHFSSSKELAEFYEDGVQILDFLKKKRANYFIKHDTYLVDVELPIVYNIAPNVYFKGYIDLIFYSKILDKYTIIDFKTSTSGWSDYQKKDFTKVSQLLLYKEFFSKTFNVDLNNIDVEYWILKRKINEDLEFVPKRVQIFKPAAGKINMGKVNKMLKEFVESSFDENGNYRIKEYPANPSKSNCRFCPFNDSPEYCSQAYKE